MADHSGDDDTVRAFEAPDYELPDRLDLDPDQMKLLLEPTRLQIIDLLSERAATTSQLADVMERPKGTIGHHCKALEAAGLIHVVRTGRVRAIEERYYGRTARVFILGDLDHAGVALGNVLDESYQELRAAATTDKGEDEPHLATARYARIPASRAKEWSRRLSDLLDEFAGQRRSGDETFGLLIGLYRTDRPGFGAPDEDGTDG